jgi:hypothetical protein
VTVDWLPSLENWGKGFSQKRRKALTLALNLGALISPGCSGSSKLLPLQLESLRFRLPLHET